MSGNSKIEWTDATWNPIVGCTHVSDGCGTFDADGTLAAGGCYAVPQRLDQPLRWRDPRLVFVNSMSDLFHEGVPDRAGPMIRCRKPGHDTYPPVRRFTYVGPELRLP